MASKPVTVPLPEPLLAYVAQAAKAEDRTIAGQIRHLVAEARRQAEQGEPRAA